MKIIEYINLLIDLEINISKIYRVFSDNNYDDHIFWRQLSNEESNHASLLETCIDFVNTDLDVSVIIPDNIENLIESNNKLIELREEYSKILGRDLSFEIAMNIESNVSEIHYQEVMTSKIKSNKILNIIKKLNNEDINHYNRIKNYYESI